MSYGSDTWYMGRIYEELKNYAEVGLAFLYTGSRAIVGGPFFVSCAKVDLPFPKHKHLFRPTKFVKKVYYCVKHML